MCSRLGDLGRVGRLQLGRGRSWSGGRSSHLWLELGVRVSYDDGGGGWVALRGRCLQSWKAAFFKSVAASLYSPLIR